MSIGSPLSPKSDAVARSIELSSPAKNQQRVDKFSFPITDDLTLEKIKETKPNLIASAATDIAMAANLSLAGRNISDKPNGASVEKTSHERARINDYLLPVNCGMDKVFYHAEGDCQGFLDTKQEVKDRELEAYRRLIDALQGTRVRIPEVIDDRIKQAPIVRKKGTGDIVRAEGYWIEFIPNMINFKPITAAISTFAHDVGRQNNPAKLYQLFINEKNMKKRKI